MNSKPYSISTKEMVINSEHKGTVSENCFCPVYNEHMSLIKRNQPLDNQLAHNSFSSDGNKERWYPKDCLQTVSSNLHQTMNCNTEKLLKLNPYLILDTDPTLDNMNCSNISRCPHSVG